MKKSLILLSLFCSSAIAEQNDQKAPQSIRMQKPQLAQMEQNKSSSRSMYGWDFYIYADGMLVKPREESLGYVVQNATPNVSPPGDEPDNGTVRAADFEWEFGFKIGLGFVLPPSRWAIDASWFYTHSDTNASIDLGDTTVNGVLFSTWINPGKDNMPPGGGNSESLAATANWRLSVNLFDLKLMKQFSPNSYFHITPTFGLKGGRIRQHYDLTNSKLVSAAGVVTLDAQYNHQLHCHFWGVGMMGGLNTVWDLAYGFSFFGQLAMSLLYGEYDSFHHEFFTDPNNNISVVKVQNDFYATRLFVDMMIGLMWMYRFEDWFLKLRAGWTLMDFVNQNRFMLFNNAPTPGSFRMGPGDLLIQGWFFGFNIGF